MMKIILPALRQSNETVKNKISKIPLIALLFTFFILVPALSWEYTVLFDDRRSMRLIIFILIFSFAYLINFFLPSIITKVIDSIFYKTSSTMVECVRALLPLRLLFVYLEILFCTYIPVVFLDSAVFCLNLWFYINMFISLTRTLDYSKMKASVPTVIHGLIIVVCNILFG